jgi:hypothetical protein
MFKSLDEMIQSNQSRFQRWREAVVRWASGIVLAAASFEGVYSLIFALEW